MYNRLKRKISVVLLLLLMIQTMIAATLAQASHVVYDGNSSVEQQKALEAINLRRRRMGMNEVVLDPALFKAAFNHAQYADANYTFDYKGNLSMQTEGNRFFTHRTIKERVTTAGYAAPEDFILETVFVRRQPSHSDMASEIRGLSFSHWERETMLHPVVSSIGIARVGKATVIVGAGKVESDALAPASVYVYPYDGMSDATRGFVEMKNPYELIQGESMCITIFSNKRDVSGMKASLSTYLGNRRINIPLDVIKLEEGYGYRLITLRQLRSGREYKVNISFKAGDELIMKEWTFKTIDLISMDIHIDDMPILSAPFLWFNKDNKLAAPLRFLLELFGAEVQWHQDTKTITAVKEGLTLVLVINSNTAYINGRVMHLDFPPFQLTIGYTTYVPPRLISEALGYEVTYNPRRISPTLDIWTGIMDDAPAVYE